MGSSAAVARRVEVSEPTLSQLLSGTYTAKGNDIYGKIARALGMKVAEAWQIITTRNYSTITSVLNDCQDTAQFRIISERAGSGKTTAAKQYQVDNPTSVYYVSAREWSRTRFMETMMRTLGLAPTNNVDTFIEKVSEFVMMKSKPLIIIDEADKLKPSALRLLIPLYNECEGRLGLTILGTDNLEKELKRGVRHSIKGYDEIFSRFGRTCVHLVGEDKKSVANICRINGISDPSVLDGIWKGCQTESVPVGTVFQMVVKDLRQLKQKIQVALLIQSQNKPLEGLAA